MTAAVARRAAPPTPTPSPFDTFEASIPQARQATQQNPTSAQAWIDLGNVLYDSAQVVRESAPDSPIYQQRLGRWLEATSAYSQALALDARQRRRARRYGRQRLLLRCRHRRPELRARRHRRRCAAPPKPPPTTSACC